jgi:hypothetical protein
MFKLGVSQTLGSVPRLTMTTLDQQMQESHVGAVGSSTAKTERRQLFLGKPMNNKDEIAAHANWPK